ncbi:ScbR family autoregulator-binding transcription factor [Streptomyces sp. MMBL 11-3]|uniref:ScbR family autoregulator-binding transcription factor n=1 Tax=Streptomyces sp. MMBL 11-3 TaxID=3382639 RepID=UPI0039B69FB9
MRTRRQILDAAGEVFAGIGYEKATVSDVLERSGVTKGALYFHFSSKEDIARALLAEQTPSEDLVTPQRYRLQEVVDGVIALAGRLRDDARARGCFRLCLEHGPDGKYGRDWFLERVAFNEGLLVRARERGELAAHVTVRETAEFLVSAFIGLQLMSQAVDGETDLDMEGRVGLLLRQVMPHIAIPAVCAELDFGPARHRAAPDRDEDAPDQDGDASDRDRATPGRDGAAPVPPGRGPGAPGR